MAFDCSLPKNLPTDQNLKRIAKQIRGRVAKEDRLLVAYLEREVYWAEKRLRRFFNGALPRGSK